MSARSYLACAIAFLATAITAPAAEPLTAQVVIDRIQKHVGVPWRSQTVDTVKAGDPNTTVTGIATTFAATFDVLKRAAAAKKNLIIAHEPTFYNHQDKRDGMESDAVLVEKQRFITEHHMVVFRFHDHWHDRRPDGIEEGMVKAIGWTNYRDPASPFIFNVPATTLDRLASNLKDTLLIRTVRVIGDPKEPVKRVGMVPGAAPSSMQIQLLQHSDIDAVVVGESREWETVEYTRDAVSQGRKKALILLGHVPSEEAGMKECAEWLKTFVPEVPIEYVPAGEPFWAPK